MFICLYIYITFNSLYLIYLFYFLCFSLLSFFDLCRSIQSHRPPLAGHQPSTTPPPSPTPLLHPWPFPPSSSILIIQTTAIKSNPPAITQTRDLKPCPSPFIISTPEINQPQPSFPNLLCPNHHRNQPVPNPINSSPPNQSSIQTRNPLLRHQSFQTQPIKP